MRAATRDGGEQGRGRGRQGRAVEGRVPVGAEASAFEAQGSGGEQLGEDRAGEGVGEVQRLLDPPVAGAGTEEDEVFREAGRHRGEAACGAISNRLDERVGKRSGYGSVKPSVTRASWVGRGGGPCDGSGGSGDGLAGRGGAGRREAV